MAPCRGTLGEFYFLLYIFVYYSCHLRLSKCCKMLKSFPSYELKEIAKEIGEDKHLRSIFVHIIKDMITFPHPPISCLKSSLTSPHHLLSPRHTGLLTFLGHQGTLLCRAFARAVPAAWRVISPPSRLRSQSPPQGSLP